MAKKKQRINLIDRNGNSQVVQVNSSDLSDSTKGNKKASLGNVVKNTVSGIVKGGNTKAISDERNYGPLTSVARTVTGGVSSAKDKQGHNLIDNTNQVRKNLVSGTFSGLTSIPDSELYEVRNSLEKGEKKAEETTGVRDTLKNLFGTGKDALLSSNPITAQFVKDDDDSKGVEGALKGLKNVSDISGGKKGLYKSIEAFGEAYSDYKKSKGKEGKLSEKVEKLQEKIDKPAEEYAQKVQEENQSYSKPTQVIGETFQTVGNMAPSIAMSVATKDPSAGMWALYQGAKGSATKEALQKGADLDTATAIGNAKGLLEVGTEQLSGGIKFKGKSVYGQGALDDVIENNVNRLVKNKAANWLVKQFGTAPLGEIAEETISDLAGHFIDKNTVDPNAKYTAKDWLHTAGMTYLSTLTLNLLGGSFGKSSYNQNLQSMAETQVADIQNRVDRGLMSQEDGARAIEQITKELNDSIGTNEEISTPEEIQEALANTSPEEIQQAVASAANAITNQIEQGKLNEQQGQQLLTTIQENAQNLLEQQQSMQNSQQNTVDSKLQIVQNLNDTERAALTEVAQKIKNGEQLNEQDRAVIGAINNNYASQDLEGPPVEEEQTPYSKQMTQEEADAMQKAHSESLDRMAEGEVGRTPGEQLVKDNNVSDRRVNAIQYDNPEIKKYYKQAAEVVGAEAYDAKNQSFQSGIREQQDELGRTEYRRYAGWNGFISKDLSDLARNNHLTAKQIEKAANDIMEDNGKENNANAKKLEKVLDKRLREGYSAYGDNFEPNQDYIDEMENIAYEKQRQGELESLENGSKTVETNETTQNNKQESTENSAFNLKEKQNEIIQNTNPMNNEYNTGIRNENDIRTWDEVLNLDDDSEGQFAWGDYTREDALRDQQKGTVTVYSSYPIENGNFVSTSKIQAEEYAGGPGSKVYSKEVPLNEVAWINGDEGQYAKVENNQQNIENQAKQENIADKVEDNVITIKNDDLKDTPKDQIKTEDTGISIGDKPVKMEIPIDSKQNKIGQYVPKDGFTQKELKDGKIGDSKFYRNVTERADFITDEVRKTVKDDDNIKHYKKVTNEESMQEAFDDLNTRGTEAIAEFFNTDKELTAKDTAMGWLLIEQSQANGDYKFANQVLRKMRDNATKTGQTMQMYNYYARLTPEGMYKWCGDQLLRAEEIFEKGKTKKWIEQNKDRWQLNGEEVEFINKQMERVQELNKMNDNDKTTIEIGKKKKEVTVDRAKQVEIAKIQSMIENKIPPQKGQALNAWMRISMLGNLKTIGTRNPLGNIALRPINDIGDFTSSLVDLAISKKTGVRTKGNFNPLAQAKGMARGASETIQDARLGINTRDAKGNRFEIGQGKSFNEHHKGVAKVLNPFSKTGNFLDSKISFLLDLGDRPFFEATYQQSLENQMKLNKIDKIEDVPDWMKNIAEQEALERTYQDDNNYTSAVIDIRKAMNKFNVKGYGLGDVIIPFAKTPANITKAIVDYSPAGFVNALTKGKELRRSIQNGQFTPEMQHAFVNQLGKATAGTMLYGIGAALANAGVISGGADEDKDVADFMRNTLGIQPYSIKIGDKSFTYDWAQPVASAFAIPADIKKGIEDAKEGEVDLQYIIHKAFNTSGSVLLEQSFLQGIKDVLGGYGDPLDNLMSEIEGLPARAIPTLFQQIVTFFDGTKRMSYGNKGIQNVIAQAQTKTPWAKDLPVYRNSMGKEIQMYGGKNNFFNVFLNPANYSEGNATESAEEIYRVYQATNKKEILPRLVDNSIKNEDGTKLTNEQKSEWLRISGGIIDKEVESLTKNGNYLKMSDEDKADTIKAIVDYAYNKAREDVTGHKLSSSYQKAKNAQESGYAIADYYITQKSNKKEKTTSTNTRNRYMEAKEKGIDGKTFDDFHAFVASARGESRTGGKTKKQKIIDYIQGLPLTREQKEALYNDYLENNGIISYYN